MSEPMKYPKRYSPFYTLRNGDTGLATFGVEPRDDGIYVEHSDYWKLFEEVARLKAEAERLEQNLKDEKSANANVEERLFGILRRTRRKVERLTKAGDALHGFLVDYIVESRLSSPYLNKLDDGWHAAKGGKQS